MLSSKLGTHKLTIELLALDPFLSENTQGIVSRARRRESEKYPTVPYRLRLTYAHRHPGKYLTYLRRLPLDILLIIADMLPSKDTVAFQKAMRYYLGDAYWRSKIPRIFWDIRNLSNGYLDWEYLCLKLEVLETGFYGQMNGRRHVLPHLDEIASIIADKLL